MYFFVPKIAPQIFHYGPRDQYYRPPLTLTHLFCKTYLYRKCIRFLIYSRGLRSLEIWNPANSKTVNLGQIQAKTVFFPCYSYAWFFPVFWSENSGIRE